MNERIGFIGLGDQGGPMARRIGLAGFDLTLWARRPEVLAGFADLGATFAPSIAALGAECTVVGVCVFDDAGVAEVVGELLRVMKPGSVILIHSTVTPGLCKDLAQDGATRGIAVLDAPVSGGSERALDGELTVMVGGDAAAFARVQPVLAAFAKTVVRLGEAGAGQHCKLINNAVATVHFATALAFFEAGERLGLDRAALVEILSGGSAQSFGIQMMAGIGPEGLAFALPRLEKDVALMLEVFADAGLDDLRAVDQSRRGLQDFAAYAHAGAAQA